MEFKKWLTLVLKVWAIMTTASSKGKVVDCLKGFKRIGIRWKFES